MTHFGTPLRLQRYGKGRVTSEALSRQHLQPIRMFDGGFSPANIIKFALQSHLAWSLEGALLPCRRQGPAMVLIAFLVMLAVHSHDLAPLYFIVVCGVSLAFSTLLTVSRAATMGPQTLNKYLYGRSRLAHEE